MLWNANTCNQPNSILNVNGRGTYISPNMIYLEINDITCICSGSTFFVFYFLFFVFVSFYFCLFSVFIFSANLFYIFFFFFFSFCFFVFFFYCFCFFSFFLFLLFLLFYLFVFIFVFLSSGWWLLQLSLVLSLSYQRDIIHTQRFCSHLLL